MLAAVVLAQADVQLHGWIDTYYAFNANRPADHASFLPGTGTTAVRANEFSVNAAALDVSLEPKPVGFHLTVALGTGLDVVHAAEPQGTGIGAEAWRAVYQASASYVVPVGSGLLVEAGIYPSHIGYETFFSKDNWNYTRGWMGEYSPYYQTGVKVSYSFDAHWSARIDVLNGWQLIGDNNRAKAVGTQVAWTSERATVAFNTFAGPELPGDDSHWRLFGDLTAQYKLTGALALGATVDVGWQDRAQRPALWHAASLYARQEISGRVAVALRAEYYDDRDGFMSGTPQTLLGGTATLEIRPADHLILKLEGRYDHSDASVFKTSDGTSQSQALAVAGAVATF
jgi:hypothetical protein